MTKKQRAIITRDTLKKLYPEKIQPPLHYKTHWQLFVAVILSAQCTDKRVNEITKKLFKKYKTLDEYVHANKKEFEQDIKSAGFFRSKTHSILSSAKIIQKKYNGKIPNTMDKILTLPGIGRKSANVILGHVYHKVEGIAVDTHIIRLANKFKLTNSKNPNKIEKDLTKLLPQKDWWDFSYQLKTYGRDYSPAHKNNDYTDPVSKALN